MFLFQSPLQSCFHKHVFSLQSAVPETDGDEFRKKIGELATALSSADVGQFGSFKQC